MVNQILKKENMKKSLVLATLVLALFTYGCGSKPAPTTATKMPATTPAAKPAETAKPEPAKTAAPEAAKAKNPEEFIKMFMDAYQKKNKAEVQKYATADAMKNLRFEGGPIEDLYFQGCNEERGEINCAYTYGGGSMSLSLKTDATTGYKVTAVEESAD
jgi:hypothetical protein